MRGSHLRKFLKTLDLLSRPNGASIAELMEELELDRSGVYRHLEFVQDLGFPVFDDREPCGRKVRKKLMDGYLRKLPNMNIPDVVLKPSEVIALYLLKGEGRLFRDTEIGDALEGAFTKIGLFADDGVFCNLKKVKTLLVPCDKGAKDYSKQGKVIDDLARAIFSSRVCRMTYHSFHDDKMKELRVAPLHFFENHGGLYLFVRLEKKPDILVLAVDRIKKLDVTDRAFEYPDDFDPEKILEPAFGVVYDEPVNVKVWFSREQARYVKERRWAAEQRIMDNPDGSIILEMKTSGRFEVKKWVLSWGAAALVLEPADLRDEVAAELKAAAQAY